jgi:hypothetical protein
MVNVNLDSKYRNLIIHALDRASEVGLEFFEIPASKSGKYHPSYALGRGGLVRHTLSAILIAKDLFELVCFTKEEKQQIITALALHDLCKPDKDHPILVKELLYGYSEWLEPYAQNVLGCIESHMGQWDNGGTLPRPEKPIESFVHMCDFLASRKYLEVPLTKVYTREEFLEIVFSTKALQMSVEEVPAPKDKEINLPKFLAIFIVSTWFIALAIVIIQLIRRFL